MTERVHRDRARSRGTNNRDGYIIELSPDRLAKEHTPARRGNFRG